MSDLKQPLLETNGHDANSDKGTFPEYTLDEVKRHNKKGDCWVVLHGRVLNVNKWLPYHPGGEAAILAHGGMDASDEFDVIHPSGVIERMAPDAIIGTVKGAQVTKWMPKYPGAGFDESEGEAVDYSKELAEWQPTAMFWRPELDVELLQKLMQRRDDRPLFDFVTWLLALAVFGTAVVRFRDTWLVVPCLFCYGLLYGTACGGREHETGHGTCFKTPVLNRIFYHVTCFFRLMLPVRREDFHAAHHRETANKTLDPEIVQPSPPNWRALFLNIIALENVVRNTYAISCHACGVPAPGSYHGEGAKGKDAIPSKPMLPPMHSIITARIYLSILGLIAAAACYLNDPMPVILAGPLPLMYGGWLGSFFSLSQHAGLAFDVPDHRATTRTIYMNPVFRWMYMNMNYHIEHHVLPRVPYYNLPMLHEAIKDQCAPANSSCAEALVEILSAMWKQRTDPGYYIKRQLPNRGTGGLANQNP